jgi:Zn-dependent protease/CBS domain-containing protein
MTSDGSGRVIRPRTGVADGLIGPPPHEPPPRDPASRASASAVDRDSPLGNAFRLFRFRGIDISIHVSWLVIAVLITWSLATGFFPQVLPEASVAREWILGVIAALLFFGSVLAHELAHSLVAQSLGLDVRSITLFLFGGVSNLAGEAKQPSAEFRIAIVGPLTSFAIALGAFVVALVTDAVPSIQAIAGYLAVTNALLGLFNLVPGFPLDGGRVLRSIVWQATNDLRRATTVASNVGKVIAWGLVLWGFWRIVQGDLIGGLWIAAIGWFLQNAAVVSLEQTVLESRLRRLRVSDVIRPETSTVSPTTTVESLIENEILPGGRRAVPVVDDGRFVGLVTVSDIRGLPLDARARTSVGDVMSDASSVVTVPLEAPLTDAVEALARGGYDQVPVLDGPRVVGLLTRADVIRELEVRDELGLTA